MKLDIIARTCSKKETTPNGKRIVDDAREDLILKCIDSLVKSANNCNEVITLKILDDHSDIDFLEKLNKVLQHSKHSVFINNLEQEGANYSWYTQFKEGSYSEELVYYVEDDYFHCDNAISSMMEFFSSGVTDDYKKFNGMVIYPYDCPHRYWPRLHDAARIFYQGNRYWRTINHTAGTFMIHSNSIRNFWPVFESLALNYPALKESETINLLYSNLVTHGGPLACFSPIPSVAFHMSYANEPPNILETKFSNWKEEWKNYEWN